jgi:hypothetical protein
MLARIMAADLLVDVNKIPILWSASAGHLAQSVISGCGLIAGHRTFSNC